LESPSTAKGKDWILTREAFDALLGWLDPDSERAAVRYEEIRRRLIRFFTCRQCAPAEELADETLNRVARKVLEGLAYVGETAPYFYGVAHNVYLEYIRPKPPVPLPPPPRSTEEVEREHACLEECLGRLQSRSRELIREFYQEEKQAKIEHRKRLAERLGITPNALRIQAHRIRLVLLECIRQCLSRDALL
jgi:DNA-directed RNA polymerase specialized sigma24 family protein